jgi:peptide/nickel transport system permease protein
MNDAVMRLNLPPARPERGIWQGVWRQFRRHRLASVSLVLLLLLGVLAVFAEQIAPYDPRDIDPRDAQAVRGFPQPPSLEHWLGTDDFNRDLLSRALFGMRISLAVGLLAMVISIGVGLAVGALAGYAGGLVDSILMRIVDIFLSVPSFVLFLALSAALDTSIWTIVFIIGVFSWMDVARLVRAEFLSLKQREFILAAQAIGASPWGLISRHLLPNAIAPVVVAATLAVPAAILGESALSFVGLGVPPPDASLGSMLQDAKAWLATAWWMWLVPGILISLIVLAFNFVGDGLRDALDPTLSER